ncbi:MAG: LPS export ABC transporter periplasmic protein LptC [Bosea sp. (in: a-proteobacteria)]
MVEAELEGSANAALRAVRQSERAYAAALRHSRAVKVLRKAIPVICVAAVLGLLVAPYLNPFRAIAGVSMGPLSLSGGKVTMDNPKLTGFRKDNKPYELTAKTAVQDVRKPNVIELNGMNARLQMEQDQWVRLTAKAGVFDSQKEQMQLRGEVGLKTDTGYDVKLSSADIDFKAATVNSREPVTVTSGGTRIDSKALEVTDNGKVISFLGGVTAIVENSGVNIAPDAERSGARKP